MPGDRPWGLSLVCPRCNSSRHGRVFSHRSCGTAHGCSIAWDLQSGRDVSIDLQAPRPKDCSRSSGPEGPKDYSRSSGPKGRKTVAGGVSPRNTRVEKKSPGRAKEPSCRRGRRHMIFRPVGACSILRCCPGAHAPRLRSAAPSGPRRCTEVPPAAARGPSRA
jgi:hypothetical protein